MQSPLFFYLLKRHNVAENADILTVTRFGGFFIVGISKAFTMNTNKAFTMHAINVEPTIPRSQVIEAISFARWGKHSRRIVTQPTLWRWCDLLEIPSRQRQFFQSDVERLRRLALHLNQGGSVYDFEEDYDDN